MHRHDRSEVWRAFFGGVAQAAKLLEINPFAQVIFISSYKNFSLDVYNVKHIFFLEKPIKESKLIKALTRAGTNLKKIQSKALPIITRTSTLMVPINEIVYLEKDRRKINVFTIRKAVPYSFYGKFSDIEIYRTENFCRCHNSYDINLNYVRERSGNSFFMSNGTKIPISRNKFQATKAQHDEFLQRGIRVLNTDYYI